MAPKPIDPARDHSPEGHKRWRSRSGSSATARPGGVLKTTEIVKMGTRGGWLPTVFPAVAVGLSCELEVYVPPTIHYGRDAGGDTELFAIPVTIANNAAVLSIELEVQNLKTNATNRYYSAFLGEHPREATTSNRQFAPLSIAGRGLFSDTVRFYPAGWQPKLVDAEGEYVFRLQLNTAAPQEPSLLNRLQGRAQLAPVDFRMTLPWTSDQ